jgi:hypothetical protein
MYTWALFKDCKVTEIIFGSKSQLHYFQLITKKIRPSATFGTTPSLNTQKKGLAKMRAFFLNNQGPQTLISTSTPLGSSIFIKASTVLEELE